MPRRARKGRTHFGIAQNDGENGESSRQVTTELKTKLFDRMTKGK